MSGHHDDSEGHDRRPVVVQFTPEQATELYDLACWAMDRDQDHGTLHLRGYFDSAVLKAAAAAVIAGGGNGHDYV